MPSLALAYYLQTSLASMTSTNISNQEFASPFQIAAHLEIPGLPRLTHPALAANQTKPEPLEKDAKIQSANKNPAKSSNFRIFQKLSEFDLWMAALSM
jgi:hypothetical protein